MGLKRPIRGGGSLPPWPMAPREGPTPLMAHPLSPLGFSPTWEVEGGWHPSLAYIWRGRVPFFFITLIYLSPFSFLERTPLFGVCTRLEISPSYARRRAVGIGVRIHLLSAACLV